MLRGRTRRLILKLIRTLYSGLGRVLTRLDEIEPPTAKTVLPEHGRVEDAPQVPASDEHPAADGPPAHWLELVRTRAPQLLEPASPAANAPPSSTTPITRSPRPDRAAVQQGIDMRQVKANRLTGMSASREPQLRESHDNAASPQPMVRETAGLPASQTSRPNRRKRVVTVKQMITEKGAARRQPAAGVGSVIRPHRPTTRLQIKPQEMKDLQGKPTRKGTVVDIPTPTNPTMATSQPQSPAITSAVEMRQSGASPSGLAPPARIAAQSNAGHTTGRDDPVQSADRKEKGSRTQMQNTSPRQVQLIRSTADTAAQVTGSEKLAPASARHKVHSPRTMEATRRLMPRSIITATTGQSEFDARTCVATPGGRVVCSSRSAECKPESVA